MGTFLPGTGNLGWGGWCGAGTFVPQGWTSIAKIPQLLLTATGGFGISQFGIFTAPTSLHITSLQDFCSARLLAVLKGGGSVFSCNSDVFVGGGRAQHSPRLPT